MHITNTRKHIIAKDKDIAAMIFTQGQDINGQSLM